jgi:hypothetical protein
MEDKGGTNCGKDKGVDCQPVWRATESGATTCFNRRSSNDLKQNAEI